MDTGNIEKAGNGSDYKFQANGGKPSETRLKHPRLNTALRHLHCKEKIRQVKLEEKTIRNESEIFIQNTEITKKLNFAPTQTIFRNLQPINVNDSIMISKMTKGPRKCYSNNVDKIPVPNLHDFLKPVEPLQLTVSDDLVEQYVPVIQPRAPDYRSLYHQYIKIPGLV